MKLEELIKNESVLTNFCEKKMRNNGKDCHDSITWKHEFEYHKQIVELLIELKVYKENSIGYNKEDIELNRNAMYNKAIDDFQNWIKAQKIVGVDNVTNDILVPVNGIWEYAIDVFKEERGINK